MKNKIILSGAEETIITALEHPVYTHDYVIEHINDVGFIGCRVRAFYEAVKQIDKVGLHF
ncbi:hypothetical protein FACS1894151_08180 [Spirochaetia bacterium]|nr:hypothetical protein FACS1894151_08180 [Spirochaetia bacterium]